MPGFVWAVPPIAAGLAGALVAPWAAGRARWAGMAMGYVSYLLGIGLGPLFVLVLPSIGAPQAVGSGAVSVLDSLLSIVFGVGVLWFIGAVILAPLLSACVVAGIAWAAGVRRVVAGPGTATPPGLDPSAGARSAGGQSSGRRAAGRRSAGDRSIDRPVVDGPLIAMVVVAGVLGLLWLVLVAVLQVLTDAQPG